MRFAFIEPVGPTAASPIPSQSESLRRDANHHPRNRLAITFRTQELICFAFRTSSLPSLGYSPACLSGPSAHAQANSTMPAGGSAMFHPPDFALGLSPLQYAKHRPS